MTINYSTDLDVARDLEQLCFIINEAVARATKVLEEAKEIDAVKALIKEIYTARKSLELIEGSIETIEESVNSNLKEAQIIYEGFQDLKKIPKQLDELGISNHILSDLHVILLEVQEAKEEVKETNNSSQEILQKNHDQAKEDASKLCKDITNVASQSKQELQSFIEDRKSQIDDSLNQIKTIISLSEIKIDKLIQEKVTKSDQLLKQSKQLSEKTIELSEKIDSDVQHIEQLVINHDEKVANAQIIFDQLTSTLEKIGGMDEIKKLLSELRTARMQLKESRQEVIAVRSLESYLQEFQKHRNHNQLRRWLWEELGIVGVLIYFLSLITPKNNKGR